MHSSRRGSPPGPRFVTGGIALLLAFLFVVPVPADAQYFGRNKVQYDAFDFRILTTPHFDIHYYDEQNEAMRDVSRMAERWYERLARLFQHEFDQRKPLIFYADHPDFQQTNTIGGMIGEGTGGVTESMKNRVIMPLAGSYQQTDHVLGHELVHAFQYDLAQSRRGGGVQSLMSIPLWMVEGMAEYLSVGREDPLTGMWIRDALLRDDFPTLSQMTRETRFFPYRFGQAFWTHVGGTYGDEAVVRLFRTALRTGWENGIEQVLGMSADSLSAEWRESAEAHYGPLMEGRTSPPEVGNLLVAPSTGGGRQNVAPSVSPDGSRMVFMSEKDLFSFDLFLADARTGEVIRQLSSAQSDPHWDALRFLDSSGSWSPDGSRIAFVVFTDGANQIIVVDAEGGEVRHRFRVDAEIGEVSGPTWSPDGDRIAFSGQVGGLTDLFTLDVASGDVTRHTEDRHAAFQPVYSPDGSRIAFVTDRGPETDFDRLSYSRMQIALYEVESGEIEVLDLFGNVRHSNPQFTPDGRGLYFLSDPDGFSDIYRLELETGGINRVTRIATAVSGITDMAPAMTVARETGTVIFSVFDEFEFHLYSVDSQEIDQSVRVADRMEPSGRNLSPAEPRVPSRVASYLDDPYTALAEPGTYTPEESQAYDAGLSLDWIGQPSVGVGQDRFGTYLGGSAAAFFSDMLGHRNLGVAVQAQGTMKDLGGQFVYQNLENRWNWGVAAGRMPYLTMQSYAGLLDDGSVQYVMDYLRIFETQGTGLVSYPFSSTRRIDLSAGVTRYSFDLEREVMIVGPGNQLLHHGREDLGAPYDPMNLFQSSIALVGDDSYFGFTSPIRGHRYRVELASTVGTTNFQTLTLDNRRYFNPHRNLTFAFRGLHRGRYGGGDDLHGTPENPSLIQPYFLGWETYVRGYAPHTFDARVECTETLDGSQCAEFERLMGHRIGVLNAEIRVPFIGTDQYGILDFGFLPTELIAFADAGLAWDDRREPSLEWSRTSADRIPVVSTGVGARFNLMGMLILEMHYVHPWQRPGKGSHWGFSIIPGW